MLNYTLGTIEASEALIKDLYIDLRAKVNAWSKITQQTPQARMGYVGQHLVSVVTGYPGGKSGARGYDLVIEIVFFCSPKIIPFFADNLKIWWIRDDKVYRRLIYHLIHSGDAIYIINNVCIHFFTFSLFIEPDLH